MANAFFYLLAAIFGLLFGSFANVAVLRAGDWRGLLMGRSHCPHCRHHLAAIDLIPVLSFVGLGGRCRYCKKPISWQYPLVELAAALLAIFSYWYGEVQRGSALLGITLFFSLLFFLIITVEDIRSQEISLPYCVIAGVIGGLGMWLSGTQSLAAVLEGLLAGSLTVVAITVIWKLATKTDGMGSGDSWIAGSVGAVAAWPLGMVAFAIAVLVGAVVGIFMFGTSKLGLKARLPFGPFLALGLLIALVAGPSILSWYLLN